MAFLEGAQLWEGQTGVTHEDCIVYGAPPCVLALRWYAIEFDTIHAIALCYMLLHCVTRYFTV